MHTFESAPVGSRGQLVAVGDMDLAVRSGAQEDRSVAVGLPFEPRPRELAFAELDHGGVLGAFRVDRAAGRCRRRRPS